MYDDLLPDRTRLLRASSCQRSMTLVLGRMQWQFEEHYYQINKICFSEGAGPQPTQRVCLASARDYHDPCYRRVAPSHAPRRNLLASRKSLIMNFVLHPVSPQLVQYTTTHRPLQFDGTQLDTPTILHPNSVCTHIYLLFCPSPRW